MNDSIPIESSGDISLKLSPLKQLEQDNEKKSKAETNFQSFEVEIKQNTEITPENFLPPTLAPKFASFTTSAGNFAKNIMCNLYGKFLSFFQTPQPESLMKFRIHEEGDTVIIESEIENMNDISENDSKHLESITLSRNLLKSSFIKIEKKDIIPLLEENQSVASMTQAEFERILYSINDKSINYSFKNIADIESEKYAPETDPEDFKLLNRVNQEFKLFNPSNSSVIIKHVAQNLVQSDDKYIKL